jgi:hypothetical protein
MIGLINQPNPHIPELGARGIGEIGIVSARPADKTRQIDARENRARTPLDVSLKCHRPSKKSEQ